MMVWHDVAMRALLPTGIVLLTGDDLTTETELLPEELTASAPQGEKRRQEFARGRALARAAMGQLVGGVAAKAAAVPLGRGVEGEPLWPPGITGSLSHSHGQCLAAVARTTHLRGLGVDVERVRPFSPALVERVARPEEQRWLAAQPDPDQAATLLFSAKESVYKCLYPLDRRWIGFQDVAVAFEQKGLMARLMIAAGSSGVAELEGRHITRQGFVYTVVFIQHAA